MPLGPNTVISPGTSKPDQPVTSSYNPPAVIVNDVSTPTKRDNLTGRSKGLIARNTGTFTGSATVPLWAPEVNGNRIRLNRVWLHVPGDAAISGGSTEVTIKLLEDNRPTGLVWLVWIPQASVTWANQLLELNLGDDGYTAKSVGTTFNISANATLTTGNFLVSALGAEETPN